MFPSPLGGGPGLFTSCFGPHAGLRRKKEVCTPASMVFIAAPALSSALSTANFQSNNFKIMEFESNEFLHEGGGLS